MKNKNLLIILTIISITILVIIVICNINVLKNNETISESNSLYSEIILPPGSTSADLQTAVNNAISGDTITISSDMECQTTITIPAGKEITIQSDSGNTWALEKTASGRHFYIYGSLILQNIRLDGETIGGGIYTSTNASFTMNSGTTIQNCNTSGVYNYGTFTMNDGIIRNNVYSSGGGRSK